MLLISVVFVITTFPMIMLWEFTLSLEVSEAISEDVNFHYRKFSTPPSKVATIEYSVTYNRSKTQTSYPMMGIYTTEIHENIEKRWEFIHFGQLRNENLHTSLRPGSYKDATCQLTKNDSETVHCFAKTIIHDFIPRHFGFSFGFKCDEVSNNSLKGLIYYIRIYAQTNGTTCSTTPRYPKVNFIECSIYYTDVSFPNLLGTQLWDSKSKKILSGIGMFLNSLELCYQHLYETLCHITLPKCDPAENTMIPACKETCYDFMDGCSYDLWSSADTLLAKNSLKQVINWDSMKYEDTSKLINCDYLPPRHGTIPCFYKPVTCEAPPNVDNAVINSTNDYDTYNASSQVEYSCQDETFQMEGNKTITCLYSGQWSQPAECVKILKSSSTHNLIIVLPVFIMPIITFIIILLTLKCHKEPQLPPLTRQKKYDAFVCYSYDGNDQHFAENIIRIHLEEQRPFKLCIHRRDFLAAWDIKWNIMNAIRNSNSAIIVMSQDYVNSLWCKEEFEDCYWAHMKDPAFKLFVILMQPTKTLNNDNEYIKSFFDKKTYLERNDPKLFKKIADYLSWVKEPKGVEELVAETKEPLLNVEDVKPDETEEPLQIVAVWPRINK